MAIDLINKWRVHYEGPMNFNEIYSYVFNWFDEHDYDPYERDHKEKVLEDGTREIKVVIAGEKDITEYFLLYIHVTLEAKNLKTIKVEGKEVEHGKLTVEINGKLFTDYENLFAGKPEKYFMKQLLERYIFDSEVRKALGMLYVDCLNLMNGIKALLGMHRI